MVPKSKLQKIQEKILVKGLADPHQTTNDVRSYSPVPLARTPSDNGRRQRDTLGSYSPTAEDLVRPSICHDFSSPNSAAYSVVDYILAQPWRKIGGTTISCVQQQTSFCNAEAKCENCEGN